MTVAVEVGRSGGRVIVARASLSVEDRELILEVGDLRRGGMAVVGVHHVVEAIDDGLRRRIHRAEVRAVDGRIEQRRRGVASQRLVAAASLLQHLEQRFARVRRHRVRVVGRAIEHVAEPGGVAAIVVAAARAIGRLPLREVRRPGPVDGRTAEFLSQRTIASHVDCALRGAAM